MATPYIKHDGVNYKIQAGLPTGGVDTLQFTDSASSFTQTVPAATGTLALTTIATGANALITTDMGAGFRALDGLVMPNVKGYLTNTPPGSPSNGDCYIIGAAPTGAWAGQGGKVSRYSTVAVAWEFFTPKNGWMLQANSAREIYRYTASAWEIFYQEGTYTPNWTAATTNPAIGNGSISGSYLKVGKLVTAYISIAMGSTTTFGSGKWFFSLPTTVGTGFTGAVVAESAGTGFSGGFTLNASPTFAVIPNGPYEFDATHPQVWKNGDTLQITHSYKEA